MASPSEFDPKRNGDYFNGTPASANQRDRSVLFCQSGMCVCPNFLLERLDGKPEIEQPLPGLVRHFQKPCRLGAHDIAGQIGAYRGGLFPGSFGTFKRRLNARSVAKLTPAHLKSISRHAWDLIVSSAPCLPCEVLSEQYRSLSKILCRIRLRHRSPTTARTLRTPVNIDRPAASTRPPGSGACPSRRRPAANGEPRSCRCSR